VERAFCEQGVIVDVNALVGVQLAVTIDRRDGSAVFNFEGTGPEVFGNTNAPPAVTYSAVIYSLRCMVHQDIPLNQACALTPCGIVFADEDTDGLSILGPGICV
jgi:N-methylhydantoinase B/oxoprolinase/acetone carboxylase alpha subunit